MIYVRHLTCIGKRGKLHRFCVIAGDKVHVSYRQHVKWRTDARLIRRSGAMVWRGE